MSETAQGTYTDWFWPPPPVSADGLTGYSSFEHTLVVEVDPGPGASYFWAHQFGLIGGAGGYVGLQTKGKPADTVGRAALFSIWDAVAAKGKHPHRFTEEGVGWSCGILYPWEVGRPYRLRVQNAERAWWAASVVDELTGAETEIGWIQVPDRWHRLGDWSVMWTEWYGGPLARCSDLPHASALFRTPIADDSVVPQRAHDHLATGATCDNARVERVAEGSRQQMGITRG